MATSGGGAGGFNWAGASMGIAQMGCQLGANLASLGGVMLQGAAAQAEIGGNITASMSRQAMYHNQTKNFLKAAKDCVKEAGRAQEVGRLMIQGRLNKLGRDKGHIVTSAAGSGLDVSSVTVRKTLKDNLKTAYADAEILAKNEQEAAQQKINDSISAQENAVWSQYNERVEAINQNLMFAQADLQRRATRNQLIGGALSTVAGVLGGATNAGVIGTLT